MNSGDNICIENIAGELIVESGTYNSGRCLISNGGDTTINGGTFNYKTSTAGIKSAIYIAAGDLIINSATISGTDISSSTVYDIYMSGGNVEINDSDIELDRIYADNYEGEFILNAGKVGSILDGNGSVTIKGGEVSTIYAESASGTLRILGGSITDNLSSNASVSVIIGKNDGKIVTTEPYINRISALIGAYFYDGIIMQESDSLNNCIDNLRLADNTMLIEKEIVVDGETKTGTTVGYITDTYKVEHYKQNVNGTYNSTPDTTEQLSGKTGENTVAKAKTYTGFKNASIEQQTISGDGSTVVKIYYERINYTITYKVDGSTYKEESYRYEAKVTAPSNPTKTGHIFAGWDKEVPSTMPAENITITATWTINTYKVVWKDYDGTVLETDERVEYGTIPTYDKGTLTRQYYTFKGWTPEVANVTKAAEYIATYAPINDSDGDGVADEEDTFKVIWKDYNGDTLETDTGVKYGTTPTYDREEPTRKYYTFSGWTPKVVAVTGNIEYTATYAPINDEDGDGVADEEDTFKVIWKDYNEEILETDEEVKYGTMPSYDGEAPTREYYTFTGWEPEVEPATRDVEYTATYEPINDENKNGIADEEDVYTVIWLDSDGTELEKDENVEYGITPTYNGKEPTKEYYIFTGWEPEIQEVTEDATYTATYSIDESQTKEISYTVNYYKDGKIDEEAVQTVTKTVQALTNILEVDKSQINITDKYIEYKLERTEPEVIPDMVNNGDVINIYYVKSKVINIEVTKKPDKTEYKASESFVQTGMEIEVTYDNGQTRLLDETEYEVEVDNPLTVKDKKVSVTYKANDEIKTEFEITVNKAEGEKNPAYIESLKEFEKIGILEVTYYEGLKLTDIELPINWEWKEPETKLYVNGEGEAYKGIYHSQDENYEDVEAGIIVKVRKAIPKYELPTEIEAKKGQTLGQIKDKLPEGYEFMDDLGTKVGEIGYREFKVRYTPEDTKNYQVVENIPVMIHVVEGKVPVAEITTIEEMKLVVGGKAKLTANIIPVGATNKEVIWRSSNEEIVVVDGDGNIEAKEEGVAYVIVETEEGGKTASCRIEVIEKTYEIEETKEGIYVTLINPNTTKEIFEEKLPTIYIKEILNQRGEPINEEKGEFIGTGYTMNLYDGATLKEKGIRLIVRGDVTGEGKADCTDSGKLIYHRLGKELLEGVYKKAADISGDGTVNGQDSTILIYHRLGLDGYKWAN